MPLWILPPIPGLSLFLFAACAIILVFGLSGYAIEKRKELKKEKDRKAENQRWA